VAGLQGSVHFNGKDITALHTPQIAAEHRLCAREHGHLCRPDGEGKHAAGRAQARNAAQMDAQRLQWIFKLFPAVEKFWNHPAGKLSGGQKQMLAVARAIVEPRELLIVDEPSKGLAPAIINNMIDAFDQLKKSGVTILLVEQNINFAKRLGDTVAVMDNGRVVHAGSMAALAEDEALQQSLLGLAL
jgi:branched-chain amino acid transport system ATP-binding protein